MFHGLLDIMFGQTNEKEDRLNAIELPSAPVKNQSSTAGSRTAFHFARSLEVHQLQNWIPLSHSTTFG